jgi:hypothetical protein
MVPSTFVRNNPFEGLTVRGVRDSFDRHPVKSTAAAAVFGAAFYWALKSAQKSGPIGAAVKGFVALAIMKQAKNSLSAPRLA